MLEHRAALMRASMAFLMRWEREGGVGEAAAREALLKVFQFDSPRLLDQVIRIWQDPWSDRRRTKTPSRRTQRRMEQDLGWRSLYMQAGC